MSEIINKLKKLEEGDVHTSEGEEYVITENHSINDVLRFLVEALGGDKTDNIAEIEYLLETL